jgi:hypothetical protein
MMGEWPSEQIDHRNTTPSDMRWDNLRRATHADNIHNQGTQKNNTSGYKGVSRRTDCNRWMAMIKSGGNRHYLGLFKTPAAAHQAYKKAAKELHGEFARFE